MEAHSAAYQRFMASTNIDYERWHDGVPYDLDAIAELDGDERHEVERWLLARAGSGSGAVPRARRRLIHRR